MPSLADGQRKQQRRKKNAGSGGRSGCAGHGTGLRELAAEGSLVPVTPVKTAAPRLCHKICRCHVGHVALTTHLQGRYRMGKIFFPL